MQQKVVSFLESASQVAESREFVRRYIARLANVVIAF